MPHLALRDDENNTRKKRQAQLKRGPGVFVYDGSYMDTESIPTPLLTGDKELVYDENGAPVTDLAGRPVFKPAGKPVTDIHGRLVLGGIPKIKRTPMKSLNVQGTIFKAGEAVKVSDPHLALKLRGMPGFEEILEPKKASKKDESAS